MTIQEVIQSGKPFRRNKKDWRYNCTYFSSITEFNLSNDDILADDWEVKEPEFVLTRKQIEEAVIAAAAEVSTVRLQPYSSFVMSVCKKLGVADNAQ